LLIDRQGARHLQHGQRREDDREALRGLTAHAVLLDHPAHELRREAAIGDRRREGGAERVIGIERRQIEDRAQRDGRTGRIRGEQPLDEALLFREPREQDRLGQGRRAA
jgi:hypothetical protein